MTSSYRRLHAQGWVAVSAALALLTGTAAASPTPPIRTVPLDTGGSDSIHVSFTAGAESHAPPAPAWIGVETDPPGLRVFLDSLDVGLSPVAPFQVRSGRVRVRVIPPDPRRFEETSDGAIVEAAPGETLRVRFDLRPTVLLRSDPEPATLTLLAALPDGADSAAGETPLRFHASRLQTTRLRFGAMGHADSVVAGSWLLEAASRSGGYARVSLRSLHLPPPAPPPGPSLFGRRWFQWALIGTGVALSGGSTVIRREADRTYDRYLDASNPREIERLYDRTVRYDRWASATLGAGQVALTAGLFLFVTGIGR